MKIYYDKQVDAVYIEFRRLKPKTAQNRVLAEEIAADFDADGRLAGLEILDASKILGPSVEKVTAMFLSKVDRGRVKHSKNNL
ncbi:MAG: DUF2283 domain-containing protein [Planctomycetes bacterium]|nr:DUF2283 domain-containing protein [Planctomycetota bacterium]